MIDLIKKHKKNISLTNYKWQLSDLTEQRNYQLIYNLKNMQKNSPFAPFIARINNDLSNWLQRQKMTKNLLNDYKSTLDYLNQDFQINSKLMIEHGENIYRKAKTIDDKVSIRLKQGLFVQMTKIQAIKAIQSLIELYKEKSLVCEKQVAKIMTTMRQVQSLIQQYDNLPQA